MDFDYKTSDLELEQIFVKIKEGYTMFPSLHLEKKPIKKSRTFNEKTIMRNLDFTEKENHKMKIPYLNEREEKNYKENGLIPFRGFFHHIYFKYNKLPFGIVEINFIYEQLKLQSVRTRFDKIRIMNKKEVWMYCDNQENENDYEKYALINLSRENDENMMEYMKRMKMITSLYEQPESKLGQYEDELVVLRKSKPQTKKIKSIFNYLDRHKGFLQENMRLFLKTVYSYGRINKTQQDKVEKKIFGEKDKCIGLIKEIESFSMELTELIVKHHLDQEKRLESISEEFTYKYISLETKIEGFMKEEFYSYF